VCSLLAKRVLETTVIRQLGNAIAKPEPYHLNALIRL
jgi:hypothetical protein